MDLPQQYELLHSHNHLAGKKKRLSQLWSTDSSSPLLDKPLKSKMHGQCDARPRATFPAIRRHRPLINTIYAAR